MDWATIIVAALALIGTLAGSYFSNSKTKALISYRIKQLEDKVEKHNHVIERVTVLERDVKTAFREINEVKTELHEIKK